MDKFLSRKFILTLLVITLTATMVFMGIDATVITAFGTVTAVALGLYAHHNVKESKDE